MRKIINSIFILILCIPFLFINAHGEDLHNYLLNSNFIFSPEEIPFNYIYVNDYLIDGLDDKMINFPKEYNIEDSLLKFSISIGNNKYLNIVYKINNNNGEYLYYTIDSIPILLISNNSDIKHTNVDLRNDEKIYYKLDRADYITTFEGNPNLDIDLIYNYFIEYFGFYFFNVIDIYSEEECEELYQIGHAAFISDLFNYHKDTNFDYYFILGEYDKNKAGIYDFYLCIITLNAKLSLYHYKIVIYDEKSIYCDDLNISYKKNITLNKYRNTYVHGISDKFDISKIKINSDYFYGEKTIGEYIVNIEYLYNNYLLSNKGIINVIDDIKPVIEGDLIIEDKLSLNNDLPKLFKDYYAYDEIDGDITNKIEVTDLDSYLDNPHTPGEYHFKLTVSDDSGNIAQKNIKYILINDIENIDDSSGEEIDEEPNIDEEIDNNINIEDNDPVNNNTEENKEDISNDEEKEDNNEIIVNEDYIFKTNINNFLDEESIKKKLLFYGLIKEDFNGEILSDYFGSEKIAGEYQILVIDDNKRNYYSLIVENVIPKDDTLKDNNKNDNSMMLLIIIFSSIIGILIIFIIVLIIIMNKKKLNKQN